MANLLDSLSHQFNARQTDHLAKLLGVNKTQLPQGMATANALLLDAVNTQCNSADGADTLLASLNLDKELRRDAMASIQAGHGYPILDYLFGIGLPKVTHWVQDTAEIDVAPYLPAAAVAFMHALEERVLHDKLDAGGLGAFLKKEYDAFALAQPQLASQLHAAIDLGQNTVERAERLMERFTPEDWDTLAKLPSVAAFAVMMSALSGPAGINKEYASLFQALADVADENEPDSLVSLCARSYNDPAQVDALGITPQNAHDKMRDACLDALAILNDNATHEEILAYKHMVVTVARRVAQAAQDGGVLGMGRKPVSADEQRTLDLLAAALAYTE